MCRENLWINARHWQLVFYKDVEANQFVIPAPTITCAWRATVRLKSVFDWAKPG